MEHEDRASGEERVREQLGDAPLTFGVAPATGDIRRDHSEQPVPGFRRGDERDDGRDEADPVDARPRDSSRRGVVDLTRRHEATGAPVVEHEHDTRGDREKAALHGEAVVGVVVAELGRGEPGDAPETGDVVDRVLHLLGDVRPHTLLVDDEVAEATHHAEDREQRDEQRHDDDGPEVARLGAGVRGVVVATRGHEDEDHGDQHGDPEQEQQLRRQDVDQVHLDASSGARDRAQCAAGELAGAPRRSARARAWDLPR